MPTLSIVIVSWNTCELLRDCLQSVEDELAAFHRPDIEVIVVDNASVDGSGAMVTACFPWVRLAQNSQNIGFAAANNQALQEATGDYLLLLNPDTQLLPGALIELLAFMDQHPCAGAAGSRLLNPDGTLQPSCSRAPSLSRELWRLLHFDAIYPYAEYRMRDWSIEQPRPVDVIQGASMLVRRTVLTEVGFLDTDYFMYSEEVDLCYRIRRAGWQIFWVPQSKIVHYGGQSSRQTARAMFLQLYRSKILYFRKQKGKQAARVYKGALLLAAVVRLALSPIAQLQSAPRRAHYATLAGDYLNLVRNLHKM